MEVADVADQTRNEQAAQELRPANPATIDAALGPNWERWQQHVAATAFIPDPEDTGTAAEVQVPLYVYGDGPHDYISTDVGAGEILVRDGNDPTGKAWKYPVNQFTRFVKLSRGEKLEDEERETGDNPIEAARKLAERTAQAVQRDRDAAEERVRAQQERPGNRATATDGQAGRSGKK